MLFSKKSTNLLERMRIKPDEYCRDLSLKFGLNAAKFNNLIEYFDCPEKTGSTSEFINFCASFDVDLNSELGNWLYELHNNLDRFYDGGVFNLFKTKQAEWGAPRVYIRKVDVPDDSEADTLDDPQVIYRGLSLDEYEKQDYAQSWTKDISKAKYFASEVYSDEEEGIVVEAMISKGDVIYYRREDPEQEIIIKYGSINVAKKI